ncbi:MAG: ABC transporter substrate-binding protein [Chloroflexi bacterium]|nr:ABC transporter substrate-binding protein [Chloroflexota bacterium]
MANEERPYWQRLNARKISRRRTIQGFGIAGAGLSAAALVGCGGDDDDDDTGGPGGEATATATSIAPGAGQQVKKGGHFTVHMGGSPRTLDPHYDTFPYNTAITTNTNNGLLQFTPDLSKVEGDLALTLPEQPDPLSYVFKIPPGVKFHDVDPVNGREFTAQDIKYSIERQMTDKAGVFQHAYFFLNKVTKIEVIDNTTVKFTLNKPFAPFISYMASPWTLMVCREVVEKDGDLTQRAIGTGPFIFKEWQKDVKFELVKNPNYYKKELPNIDQFTILLATDPDTSASMFIDKKVDAIVSGVAQLKRIQDARKDVNYQPMPSQFWKQMRMPPTTKDQPYPAPFNDKRVREAIVRAINKQQVLDLVYNGDGAIAKGPILPQYSNWALKEEPVGFDLNKAKALMGEAAQTAGFSGEMIWATGSPQQDQIAEVLKQQLKEIKVNLELKPMELAAYYNQTYSYKYTFSHHTPLNNPDPDENLASYFGRSATFFKYYNEAVWDKIDQQAAELDTEKRKAIVQEVQKTIALDFPMAFMHTTNNHNFTDKKVKGWFYSPDLYNGRIHKVWLDV